MNFYWSHAISLQKLSNERPYKFSCILTLTEVISISLAHALNFRRYEFLLVLCYSPSETVQ